MRVPAGRPARGCDSSQGAAASAGSEDDRASAVDDDAVLEVQRHSARQDQPLDVAADALEIVDALAMVDANHVLIDDRSVVKLFGNVVGGGTNQLDPPLPRPAVWVGSGERGKEGVVDVDCRRIPTRRRKSPLRICM